MLEALEEDPTQAPSDVQTARIIRLSNRRPHPFEAAGAGDLNEAAQTEPVLALGGFEPIEVVGDFHDAVFDPAVALFRTGIMRADPAALGPAVFHRFGVGKKCHNFPVQGAVFAFSASK